MALLATFAHYDRVYIPWELETPSPLRDVFDRELDDVRSVLVVIGPEGGFSADEVERAQRAGATAISLGTAHLTDRDPRRLVVLSAILYARGEL